MTVERMLQISVATVASLGACLLGLEHGTSLGGTEGGVATSQGILPFVVLVAAVTSVIVTDIKGWIDLPRLMSNLVALVALVMTVGQITRIGDGSDLIALAKLLVYLQVVLLFHKKRERDYWQIMALSLLQVVVAAALNMSLLFGVLLAIYFFAALIALSLLFVHRETDRIVSVPDDAAEPASRNVVVRQETCDYSAPPHHGVAALPSASGVEWLAAQTVNRGFWYRCASTGIYTLLLTVIVFFAIPRMREEDPSTDGQRMATTGISDEVSLGQVERLLENPEAVFRASFVRQDSGTPLQVWGEPYFHGTVVSSYQGQGRWKSQESDLEPFPLDGAQERGLVRQDFVVEPGAYPYLFSVAPAVRRSGESSDLRVERVTRRLSLRDKASLRFKKPFQYSVWTTGMPTGTQQFVVPETEASRHRLRRCLAYRIDQLPETCALSDQIVSERQISRDNRVAICRALESHFLRSGDYRYSLGASPNRRRDRDPIEDFVSNHKSGHCEYFASALVLMLRHQGIPARLVLGYKGGEYNEPGQYHIVRQLHAHAWVEAFLESQHLADAGVATDETITEGWLRLDPTPGGETPDWALPGSSALYRFNQWVDYVEVMWDQYVLGLNFERQREAVYGPIVEHIARWSNPDTWMALFTDIGSWLGLTPSQVQRLAIWFVVGTALALLAGLGGAVQLVRWVVRFLWRWRAGLRGRSRADTPAIPFFSRWEDWLRDQGMPRSAEQTPREAAHRVEQHLLSRGYATDVATISRRLVDAYYHVRYGDQPLSDSENRRWLDAVAQLESALPSSPRATHDIA